MAGSWTNGWAGWWPRRWPQLPPPPHVWVWAEEPPKAFLLLWLLKGTQEKQSQTSGVMHGEQGHTPGRPEPSQSELASPPVRLVPALSFALQDPLQHVLSGVCGAAGQLQGPTVLHTPLCYSILSPGATNPPGQRAGTPAGWKQRPLGRIREEEEMKKRGTDPALAFGDTAPQISRPRLRLRW